MLNYKEGLKTKNGSSISFDTGASKKLCNGSSNGGPPTGGDPSPPKPEVPLPGSSPPKCSEASAAMNANAAAAAAAAAAYLAKTTEKAIHRKIGQICYDTFGNIIKVDKTPTNDIITQIKPFQKSIGQVCYDTYGNIIQTKSNGNAAASDQDHGNTDQEAVVTKGTKRPISNENDNTNPSNGSTSPSSSNGSSSSSSSGNGDHANSVTKTKRTKMCNTNNGLKSESLENDSDKNGNNTKEALFSSSSIDPEVAPDQLPSAAGKLFLKHLSKNNLLQKCKLPRKQFEDAISNVFKNSTPVTSSTDKNNCSNNGFVEKDFLHIQDKIMEVVFNPNINNVIELSKIHEGKAKSLAFNIRAALSVIIGRPITDDDFEKKSSSNSSENEDDTISNDMSDDAKVDIKYLEVLIDMEPFGIFATLRLVLD